MISSTPSRHVTRRLSLRGEARIDGTQLTPAQVALLESKLVETPDGCWIWTATLNDKGYPIAVWRAKCYRVHKLMNERAEGTPVPDGLEVDHRCENRACCNPAHLERVSHSENVRRIHARAAVPFNWREARDAKLRDAHLTAIWNGD